MFTLCSFTLCLLTLCSRTPSRHLAAAPRRGTSPRCCLIRLAPILAPTTCRLMVQESARPASSTASSTASGRAATRCQNGRSSRARGAPSPSASNALRRVWRLPPRGAVRRVAPCRLGCLASTPSVGACVALLHLVQWHGRVGSLHVGHAELSLHLVEHLRHRRPGRRVGVEDVEVGLPEHRAEL